MSCGYGTYALTIIILVYCYCYRNSKSSGPGLTDCKYSHVSRRHTRLLAFHCQSKIRGKRTAVCRNTLWDELTTVVL